MGLAFEASRVPHWPKAQRKLSVFQTELITINLPTLIIAKLTFRLLNLTMRAYSCPCIFYLFQPQVFHENSMALCCFFELYCIIQLKKKTDFKHRFITTNTLLSFQWHLITKQRTHEKSRRSNPGSSASGGHWQISSCPLVLCPNERFKPSKSSSSLSDKLNGPRWGGVGVSCPELQGESLPREEGLLSEVYFGRRQEDMPCRCSCPAVSEPAGWRRCRSAGEPDSTLAALPSKIRYQINI